MGILERLFSDPASAVVTVLLLLFAFKEGYELYRWYKSRGDDYYTKRKAREKLDDDTGEHGKALDRIGGALEDINKRLDRAEEERKKDTIATSRATLLQLYDGLREKDTLTLSEYETFNSVSERYLAAGGNSIFRDKIIPEIKGKKIDDERG